MQDAVSSHPMFEELCTEACKGLPERDHQNEAWARLEVKQYYYDYSGPETEKHVNERETKAKQQVEVCDNQDFQKAEKALMAGPEPCQVVFGNKSQKSEPSCKTNAEEEQPEEAYKKNIPKPE